MAQRIGVKKSTTKRSMSVNRQKKSCTRKLVNIEDFGVYTEYQRVRRRKVQKSRKKKKSRSVKRSIRRL